MVGVFVGCNVHNVPRGPRRGAAVAWPQFQSFPLVGPEFGAAAVCSRCVEQGVQFPWLGRAS